MRPISFRQWRKRGFPINGFRFITGCSISDVQSCRRFHPKMVTLGLYHLICPDGTTIQALTNKKTPITHSINLGNKSLKKKSRNKQKTSRTMPKHIRNTNPATSTAGRPVNKSAKSRNRTSEDHEQRPQTKLGFRTHPRPYIDDKNINMYTKGCLIRSQNSSHIDKDSFNSPLEGIPLSALGY